jgi:uncharacterized membrane protein YcjF (UPF0283 family)
MLWQEKASALVRTIKEVPNAISNAGRISLSGLEEAGKFARRTPDVLGQVGSLTAAAFGRVVRREPTTTAAAPTRYVPHYAYLQRTRLPRAIIIVSGFLVLALAAALIDWIVQAIRTVSISGLLWSPIFVVAFATATFWLWRQFRSWQSLAIVEQVQSDLSSRCETPAEQERFRAAFAWFRSRASEPQLVEFLSGANETADAAKLQDELDRIGLKGMDKHAVDAIRDAARDVFVLSLVSTNALAEVVIFSVRAFGLIRRVASAYGYRPGRFGLIRLARHVLADIALLPVGMLVGLEAGREAGSAIRNVSGLGAQAVGTAYPLAGSAVSTIGNVVGAAVEGVTPRVAEATLAAGRMAHLGLLAAAIVRPVAFSRAGYGEIRNAVYKQILGFKKDAIRSRKNTSRADAEKVGAA